EIMKLVDLRHDWRRRWLQADAAIVRARRDGVLSPSPSRRRAPSDRCRGRCNRPSLHAHVSKSFTSAPLDSVSPAVWRAPRLTPIVAGRGKRPRQAYESPFLAGGVLA